MNLTQFITEINDSPTLYPYDHLSDEAKKKAMRAIIEQDIKAFQKSCSSYYFGKSKNFPNSDHIKKHNDVEYMEGYILGNLCNFLEDGTYVRYSR